MPDSERHHRDLDLDRDLPTTDADVEALRRNRPAGSLAELTSLDELNPPPWFREREGRRKVFGDQTPFEL
jgi:hypothetical protein